MSFQKNKNEYIIAIIGFVGVIAAAIITNSGNSSNPGDAAASSSKQAIPELVGLSISDARKAISASGFEVGTIESEQIWDKDAFVISQLPNSNESVSTGTTINLDIVNSEFDFRAEREVITKDDNLKAYTHYRVKRLNAPETETDVGRFEILDFDIDSDDESNNTLGEVMDKLKAKPGYMAINPKTDLTDEASSWETLTDLIDEAERQNAIAKIEDIDAPDRSSNVGELFSLLIISLELNFDFKAIFTLAPEKGINGKTIAELQEGTKLQSAIRVVGPGKLSASGTEYLYTVERRAPSATAYEEIGSASYSVSDKLLTQLKIRYHVESGDKKQSLYSLRLQKQ